LICSVSFLAKLKDLAKSYITPDRFDELENDFEKFLKSTIAKSKSHTGEHRMHKDILDSRFALTRIENTDYKDSIFGKGADFTSKSIRTERCFKASYYDIIPD
jgi:hypothetical protein